MTPLRAGVIGLGVGEAHAAACAAHPSCRLVALSDLDPDRLAALGAVHPGCRLEGDPAAVLEDPAIDLVVIASYDDAHADQVVRALGAGKHVFVEKPLCLTGADLERIRAAHAAAPGCRLSSNLVLRASPRFGRLRALVREGGLGRLYHVEADYLYGRLAKLHDGWRGRIATYSVMLGGGVHMIDLLRWITGVPVVEVAAVGGRVATEAAGAAFTGADCMTAVLRFADGITGRVSANFACVRPHFHALSLYGTEATAENRPDAVHLWTSRERDAVPRPLDAPGPEPAKGALLGPFIEAIGANAPGPVTEADVFAAIRVGCAIDEAARTGRTVAVADG